MSHITFCCIEDTQIINIIYNKSSFDIFLLIKNTSLFCFLLTMYITPIQVRKIAIKKLKTKLIIAAADNPII